MPITSRSTGFSGRAVEPGQLLLALAQPSWLAYQRRYPSEADLMLVENCR